MKWLIAVVIVVALGIGAMLWMRPGQDAKASSTTAPSTPVVVARGSIFQAVASTGRVVSNLDVDIKCKASGEVIQLPFDISQNVKKGELLVELDPIDEQRAVRQAEVALAQSQAKVIQATENLKVAEENLGTAKTRADANLMSCQAKAVEARSKADRRKELVLNKGIAQEDLDTAESEAVQAEANVQLAKAQLEELKAQEVSIETKRQDVNLAKSDVEADQIALDNAQQRLTDTKVMAPMDGVVSALTVQKGQIISSGITNVGGGTTILTLSDLSRIFVLASVDESDIGRVDLGQKVRITADAFPGQIFRGNVVRVATRGVNVSNVITFEVKIEVTGENKSLLKPEMTSNVQIVAAEKHDVLVAPSSAISRKGGKTMAALIGADGKTTDREVKTGLSDGDNVEIVSGLSEGDKVLKRDEPNSRWRADAGGRPGGAMMMGMPRGK